MYFQRMGKGLSMAISAPSSWTLKSARSSTRHGMVLRKRSTTARTRSGSAPAARSVSSVICTRTGSWRTASSACAPSSASALRARGSSSRLRTSAQASSRYLGQRPSARKSSGTRPSPKCARIDRKVLLRVPLASSGTSSMWSMSCGTPRGTRCSARAPDLAPPAPLPSAWARVETIINILAST